MLDNLKEQFQRMSMAFSIPKEMFWAYESVRQSGIYNMLCIRIPSTSNCNTDRQELIKLIDDVYIKYCVYNNVDLDDPENQKIYKHVTADHILLIQYCYNELRDAYDLPPEGVVNIKRKVKTTISF